MTELSPSITPCLLWHDCRATGIFKSQPADFVVNEILDWDFKGQGEHLFLQIEKTDCNTAWIAKQLAKFYGVPPRDVGYSGLKDRHAVTTQYFSVRLPGVKPDSYTLPEHEEYRVVSHVLHDKKLKRGNHQYNDFSIRLRAIGGDRELLEQRLAFIRDNGCPNLFDSQRFGHNNGNLQRLRQWIDGEADIRKRNEKTLLLSALRAAVFNRQLAERVQQGTWNQIQTGDTVILDGSNSRFVAETVDEALIARASRLDIHPAGLLIGADSVAVNSDCSDCLENNNLQANLQTLMRRERLEQGFRPLRLHVRQLTWQYTGDDCAISLRLPSGAYASGVLRQVFDLLS